MKAREIKKKLFEERDALVKEHNFILKENEIRTAISKAKMSQLNILLLNLFGVEFEPEKDIRKLAKEIASDMKKIAF